jgi:hypothetical protein
LEHAPVAAAMMVAMEALALEAAERPRNNGNVCYVTHSGKLAAIHPVPDTAAARIRHA